MVDYLSIIYKWQHFLLVGILEGHGSVRKLTVLSYRNFRDTLSSSDITLNAMKQL